MSWRGAAEEVEGAREQLNQILDRWAASADADNTLMYWNTREPNCGLLVEASAAEPSQFGTLWSLRDVDKESELRLIDLERGNRS